MVMDTILFICKLTYWIIKIYNIVRKMKSNKNEK